MDPRRPSFPESRRSTWPALALAVLVVTVALPAGADSAGAVAPTDPVEKPCYFETVPMPPGSQGGSPFAAGGSDPLYRLVNRFHIVRRSDGTGGLPEHHVDSIMRDLNVGFRNTPMRWVREPEIVYIDDDTLYADMPDLTVIFAVIDQYYEDGVVNWFLTPSIFNGQFVGYTSPGGGGSGAERGQVLIYPSSGQPTNIVTPPHEMGHIFNLWHPFETQFGAECTDGSNCAVAGDLICDTPSSPCVHGQNTTGTGIYYGNDPPPCPGDPPFSPDAKLYMDCGWPAGHILRDKFSPQQLNKMETFLTLISTDLLTQAPDILVDCDGNGVDDHEEIFSGDKVDLGLDMVPDVCQVFPEPGDLLVSGMNPGVLNRPRFYDGETGDYRGDMWNGLTYVHQMRFGEDGYVYLARLSLVTRMDVRTGRNVDVLLDGVLQGAGTFVDLLFDEQGDLLVLDNVSNNIRRYDGETGQYLGLFASTGAIGMTSPKYMEYGPNGNIWVVGSGALGNTVQGFDGQLGTSLGSLIQPGAGGLVTGQGILFHEGHLYVSNGVGNSVLRYTETGTFVDAFVTSGNGGLTNPHSLRFGPDGHLYVASRGTDSVKRYDGENGGYLGDFVQPGSGGPTGTGGLEEPAGLLFCGAADAVTDLTLDHFGSGMFSNTRLTWSLPESGAPLLRFDTLRASSPDGFVDALCLETDGADGFALDAGVPAPGELRYFLVRSENVCGPGGMGPTRKERLDRPTTVSEATPTTEQRRDGRAPRAAQSEMKARSTSVMEFRRSLDSALDSIWRIRSRVRANVVPISSSVCRRPPSTPKRSLITRASRGVRHSSAVCVCRRRLARTACPNGDTPEESSSRSLIARPSSPIGLSSETAVRPARRPRRTLPRGIPSSSASSASVGSRPWRWTSRA